MQFHLSKRQQRRDLPPSIPMAAISRSALLLTTQREGCVVLPQETGNRLGLQSWPGREGFGRQCQQRRKLSVPAVAGEERVLNADLVELPESERSVQ